MVLRRHQVVFQVVLAKINKGKLLPLDKRSIDFLQFHLQNQEREVSNSHLYQNNYLTHE